MNQADMDDSTLLTMLNCQNNCTSAFNVIYDRYAKRLYRYVADRVPSQEGEELIQDLFVNLWFKRASLCVDSLRAYLFGAAKNKVLNYMRHERVVRKHEFETLSLIDKKFDNSCIESLELKDLLERIECILKELSERRREAYRKSRVEHQTIDQIAKSMQISPRTVENYISDCLKHLKERLYEYE